MYTGILSSLVSAFYLSWWDVYLLLKCHIEWAWWVCQRANICWWLCSLWTCPQTCPCQSSCLLSSAGQGLQSMLLLRLFLILLTYLHDSWNAFLLSFSQGNLVVFSEEWCLDNNICMLDMIIAPDMSLPLVFSTKRARKYLYLFISIYALYLYLFLYLCFSL